MKSHFKSWAKQVFTLTSSRSKFKTASAPLVFLSSFSFYSINRTIEDDDYEEDDEISHKKQNDTKQSNRVYADEKIKAGELRPDLPEFTLQQIGQHSSRSERIWVTYKSGVYDVTEFIETHPGGDKILLAAGTAVDPYWNMYAVHKTEKVYEILEQYRIGNIAKEDRIKLESKWKETNQNDPYANDPTRIPIFMVRSEKPFNAETPLPILADKFITPTEVFYVRNHLPVPIVNEKDYRLQLIKQDGTQLSLSLQDLKNKFTPITVTTTVQCAGNRRVDMAKVKAVKGLDWEGGAIGTAHWRGASLREVLQRAGIDVNNVDQYKGMHIHFEGLDQDSMQKTKYAASIPIEKVLNPYSDILLAYEMNGEELPRDHGYPIRAIVPGVVGARNVKWVGTIAVSKEESKGFWQQNDYKGFAPNVDFSNVKWDEAPAIQDLPVQSSICEPRSASTVKSGDYLSVKGYGYSGGGRGIIRVDLLSSFTPKGMEKPNVENWQTAELKNESNQPVGRKWTWSLFESTVAVPEDFEGKLKICSKAVDDSYNVQPEEAKNIWTFRGVLSNAWSCVHLNVDKAE